MNAMLVSRDFGLIFAQGNKSIGNNIADTQNQWPVVASQFFWLSMIICDFVVPFIGFGQEANPRRLVPNHPVVCSGVLKIALHDFTTQTAPTMTHDTLLVR